jgi:hypothetical protein
MSRKPLTPNRKHLLEVYSKCIARAARRIIIGGQIANYRGVDLNRFNRQRPLIQHIADCIRSRGIVSYATALMKLHIARSRCEAELAGLEWWTK